MSQILAYADKDGKVVKPVAILATADAEGRVTPSTTRQDACSRVLQPKGVVGPILALADAAGHVYAEWDESKHPRDQDGKWTEAPTGRTYLLPTGLFSETPTDAVHYGDGGIAHDTVRENMSGQRSTGHFGTGIYFLSNQVGAYQPTEQVGITRPVKYLDLKGLKLAHGDDQLHRGLKIINTLARTGTKADLDFGKITSAGHQAAFLVGLSTGVYNLDSVRGNALKRSIRSVVEEERNGLVPKNELRSASTRVMQALGYDGVDSRGTSLDNSDYGSVVYAMPPPRRSRNLSQWDESKQIRNEKGHFQGIRHPLYVSRPVENADEIIAWAKSVGFTTTLPAEDMHVTVCYSKEPVDWLALEHYDDTLEVPPEGVRTLAWDESKYKRGKTTPGSRGGSFAPKEDSRTDDEKLTAPDISGTDIDAGMEGYLSPEEELLRDDYIYNNRGFSRWLQAAEENDVYQDALQQNLVRLGFPETFTVYRGRDSSKPYPHTYANVTTSKNWAEKLKAALSVDPKHWVVDSFVINRRNVKALGSIEENELLVRLTGEVVRHSYADRTLTNLGDDGAVVLQFESAPLQARHRYFLDQGASWDYDAYHPHITLTYEAPDRLDLSTIEPYTGRIVLGPEKFTELETGWAADIKEHAAQPTQPFEIDYAQIKNDLDAMEAKFRDALREVLSQSRDATLATIRRSKGTLPKDFKLPYTTDIQSVIRTALQRALDRGEADASKEIGRARRQVKGYAEEQGGRWVTMNGRHVFIKEGETPEQVLERVKQNIGSITPKGLDKLKPWVTRSPGAGHIEKSSFNAYLEENEVETKLREEIDSLFHSHGNGGKNQQWADGEIARRYEEEPEFRNAINLISVAETKAAEVYVQGNDDTVYRRAAKDEVNRKVLSFSKSSLGAQTSAITNPGARIVPDTQVKIGAPGYKILYGFAQQRGRPGEGEVLLLKVDKKHESALYSTYAKAPTFTPKAALKWLRAKVFWVTDVLTGGLLEDIRLAIINGLKTGKPTDSIITDIAQVYIPYLGDPSAVKDGELPTAARLETVVRTNLVESYNQGRLATFVKPDMMPFLDGIRYSAILDTRTTPVCRYLHERIFKPEDIQATGLVPPNHFQCRSLVVPVVVGEISKPPDFKVDPKVYITDEEILHAQALADAKFLEQEDVSEYHLPGGHDQLTHGNDGGGEFESNREYYDKNWSEYSGATTNLLSASIGTKVEGLLSLSGGDRLWSLGSILPGIKTPDGFPRVSLEKSNSDGLKWVVTGEGIHEDYEKHEYDRVIKSLVLWSSSHMTPDGKSWEPKNVTVVMRSPKIQRPPQIPQKKFSWDESKHPRDPDGADAGQFVSTGIQSIAIAEDGEKYLINNQPMPGIVEIDTSRFKSKIITEYGPGARAATVWAGERLFNTPIQVQLISDPSVNAHGSSSTSPDGKITQVYLNMRAITGGLDKVVAQEEVDRTVIHELVHAYQRRSGSFPKPDTTIPYERRPEERHAIDLGDMLSNQYLNETGRSNPMYNTKQYFSGAVARIKQGAKGYTGEAHHAQDEEAGVWRTVRGRRVFIREGETPTEAVKRSIAERTARSVQSHIPATKARQLKAAQYEETVAKLISGKNLDDHEPFDVIKGQHAVEVKTIISGRNPKITMHPDALERKNKFLRKEKMTGHTVVIDARGPKPVYYYREGVGSFRLDNMQTVKGVELKGLMK